MIHFSPPTTPAPDYSQLIYTLIRQSLGDQYQLLLQIPERRPILGTVGPALLHHLQGHFTIINLLFKGIFAYQSSLHRKSPWCWPLVAPE